jgi:hypothetical protein
VVSSKGTGIAVVGVTPVEVDEGVFGRLAIHHSLALVENICHGEIPQTEIWRSVILPLHALLLTFHEFTEQVTAQARILLKVVRVQSRHRRL